MWELLERVFGGGFMPHGHCYLWTPSMVWTQVTSNALIGLAYLSISATLAHLVRRVNLPFSWAYIAFGVFILACGLTHFFDIITVWHPVYWADACVRGVTALASVGTAFLILPLVPRAMDLSKVSRLAMERGQKLEQAVEDLGRTVLETKRYRLLVESVRDATFILDASGKVSTWNAAAQRIHGYASDEIVGQHFSRFYPPDEGALGKPDHALELAVLEGSAEEEGWRVRKEGSLFWAHVLITAMLDDGGRPVGFAMVTRDLTERRRTEENLRRLAAENAALAEKARTHEFQERFLAILGHDLRNPLAAFDMGSGLLRQRLASDMAATRILLRMESSSRRMSRMIEQILDLTRSRLSGGLDIHPAPMDLCAMLSGVVDELRTANPSRTVLLRCSTLPGAWDRDRLEQVFSNLIGNAIHHGVAGTPVTVEVHRQAGTVRVDVHNDGPPIPAEVRARLFSPFRRGIRDSRTSQTAGLGLGLYISHEIVLAHGGEIDCQSSEAGGTTFRVTLPREASASSLQ
ncbi:MAG: PAS domain-containing sensor histidine kinase [Myxococcota bacterium]|nr:PAS domain-containing sensor histidine kinase [Myxococcota bacterium]